MEDESWVCLDDSSPKSLSGPPSSGWKWERRWPKRRGRLKLTPTSYTVGEGNSARGPAMHFLAWGSGAGKRAGWLNWSARSASRRWRSIFCRGACSASRSSGNCRHSLENRCLPADPSPKGGRQGLDAGTDVRTGGGEPVGVLSLSLRLAGAGPGLGTPRRLAANRLGVSLLWLAADDGGAPTARLGCESQTGLSPDARG